MKVYTKTGDKGTTALLTGERVEKDCLRVEAYGSVDEVNSALGLARATCCQQQVRDVVYELQKILMPVMADLASTQETDFVSLDHIVYMEKTIDKLEEELPPLKAFLIPGDTPGAAALDMARTVTRRAERNVLRLARQERISEHVPVLLNRLSDLCFILIRAESRLSK
ncbi:hypothetical protein P22_1650 [Propionispora sp. 2/2-37]|uniref:cob(I)yrinic acid a,c-diamide adenosyltransferase n=1 Tax=Propionispora sp. 2/2-37 TaxID=1677858 RepID=UPI0006BB87A9|nr:cob(I)yrinic acid a,c-diamide adenosyltransferase [Propionispora sp. 2/2-37]CUH95577.1 hypothetical protein P22_1650 [Propionispora sp. 2/2-37]